MVPFEADTRHRALTSTAIHTFYPGAVPRHGSSVMVTRFRALTSTVIHSFYPARVLGHGYPFPCAHLDGDPLFLPGAVPRSPAPTPCALLDGVPLFYPGAGPRRGIPVRAPTTEEKTHPLVVFWGTNARVVFITSPPSNWLARLICIAGC